MARGTVRGVQCKSRRATARVTPTGCIAMEAMRRGVVDAAPYGRYRKLS